MRWFLLAGGLCVLLCNLSFLSFGLYISQQETFASGAEATLAPCASLTPYDHPLFGTATALASTPTATATNTPTITPLPSSTPSLPPTNTVYPSRTPTYATFTPLPHYIYPPTPIAEFWKTYQVQYYRGMNLRACPGLDCEVVGRLGWGMLVDVDAFDIEEADGYVWRKTWIDGAYVWLAEKQVDGSLIFLVGK